MKTNSFASRDSARRTLRDRQLLKTLTLGLCASLLAHTAAFAGMSYLAQNQADEDLEITTIERVNIDPEPKPTPTPPAIKPTPSTPPKVVKVTKSLPISKPKAVKIDTPKPKPIPIPTAEPTVKITKSAVVNKPLASAPVKVAKAPAKSAAPKAAAPKPAPIVPKVSEPIPFPDRLFQEPKPQSPKVARKSPDPAPAKTRRTVVAPKSAPPKDLAPTQPEKTNQVATAPDTNQTAMAAGNKPPQGLDNYLDPTTPNPVAEDDFSSSTPGNSKPIASNNNPVPASSNNQTGLAGSSNPNAKRSPNFDSAGGSDTPATSDDIASGTPGNNQRIANITSGSKGAPSSNANSTSLGGSDRGNGNRSISKNLNGGGNGNGNGNGLDNSGNELGGQPGNLATGSSQLSIQCLRNCKIDYPLLQASDAGKEKILVRVSIDAQGEVTNAQIAKSSGNQDLDRATIEGVKQMQLTPMGKPLTFKVKVNTLTSG